MNIKTEPTLLSCGGLLECMDLCEAVRKKHVLFSGRQTDSRSSICLSITSLNRYLLGTSGTNTVNIVSATSSRRTASYNHGVA